MCILSYDWIHPLFSCETNIPLFLDLVIYLQSILLFLLTRDHKDAPTRTEYNVDFHI